MDKYKDLEIVYKSISELKPFKRNPKDHPKEQIDNIVMSIKKYGWRQPILLDFNSGEIVAGHGRLMAAKKMGLDRVPCIDASDMTQEAIDEYRYIDNKLNESEWNVDILKEDLKLLDFSDFNIDWGIEFGDEADESEEQEVVDDEFEVIVPEEPKSKSGQLWKLGRHRLLVGDSTNPEDVSRLCCGNKVDMLLTDPPYMVDYKGTAGKIKNDNLGDEAALDFLKAAFENADANMKPGSVFYIWHADSKGIIFRQACQLAGWEVRQCLIWVKNSLVLGRQDYQWRHEPCLYGWKDGASHLWASDRKQTTILEFDKPKKNGEHHTMKPVPLFDYQMQNNTKGGDIVLDLFGGSGTTMVAAEQNGRVGYLMEFDPKYADVIINRYIALVGDSNNISMVDNNGNEITFAEYMKQFQE